MFHIRLAEPSDTPVIARHRAEMFREMGQLAGDDHHALVQSSVEYLQRALASGEYVGWLASPEGQLGEVAGGAGIQLRPLLPRPSPRGTGLIEGLQALVVNVYVEAPHRRRGLARRLMSEILAWTEAHEVQSVVLHASGAGRPLYEQLGFVPTSEMRFAGELRGDARRP